jgi:squalene-hopene/tetraprenyl-beta-curcumene cyclase
MLGGPVRGAEIDAEAYRQAVDSAIAYLESQVSDEGRMTSRSAIGVTALGVQAILQHRPSAVDSPAVKRALDFIASNAKPDGGIYATGSGHRNYETALAISALQRANRDGRYDAELKKAEMFVRNLQWDQGEGIESDDVRWGGAGYGGGGERPDLSNTAFLIDALRDLGNDADDEAIQKALLFVSRTQNLESSHNDTEYAPKVNDGGFYYTPAAGGQSKAGKTANGGLRSYGSMTYAGLKSMIYAGLDKDDPRVKAALDFIRNHYTLEQNPGMGAAGLYYYYQVFAKALSAAGIETLTDTSGESHDWQADLFATLAAAQAEDGSWVNSQNPRWMEGDRALVTSYGLLALAYCQPE